MTTNSDKKDNHPKEVLDFLGKIVDIKPGTFDDLLGESNPLKPDEDGKTPEQIAVMRIEHALQIGTKILDLSRLNLRQIPNRIGELTNLISLDLSENRLTELPMELRNLQNLKKLNIRLNMFIVFPETILELPELSELIIGTGFSKRYAWRNMVSTFKMDGTKIVRTKEEFPDTVSLAMENLEATFDKSRVNNFLATHPKQQPTIEQLPLNIDQLKNLKVLILDNVGLIEIPPTIGNLAQLEHLGISQNRITEIPISTRKLNQLKVFDIQDNPLNIPPEISSQVSKPKTVIDYYFRVIGKRKYLNETKLLIIGQGNVGKTSVVKRILGNEFDKKESKTEGIEINKYKLRFRRNQYRLHLWDFGGQEIMHTTHQFFLTKRSLYLLVLDSRLTQEENRVEYWLKIVQSFGGESPVLIVGNKIDQHPLDIDRTGLQKKYPNIVGILETSAATGAGIEALKAAITEQVNNLPHVRDLLPEPWFTVKTKLEELGKQSNFITHDKYLELCAENEVSDETSQRTLIGFLHDLGVVLHFQDDPRLEALGILNPQWVTNGVYKILNSHALFQNKGVLATSMLDEILNLPEYPRGKRLFIVDMMKKFELCYDIQADKTFLVPDLLPKDEPADLKFNGVPAFEYAYPVLPTSVITRFIVRMNQKIDDGLVWRTGVVLKIGENKALVKADIEDRKITIAIDGLEHTRRDALSAIRYQLDEIHASIKGLDAQKRVPIPNAPNAEPLEYETLLMLEREGQEEYLVRDGKRLVKVNVRQILSGIESEAQRKEGASRVTNIYIGGDVKDSNILAGDENEVQK